LLCERLEEWYNTFRKEGLNPIRDGWLARSAMAGRTVRVLLRDEVREGRMESIDGDGALLLADGRGEIHRIVAGDATIVKG